MDLRGRKTFTAKKFDGTRGSWDSQSKALVRPRVSKTAYDSSAAFDKDKDWLGSRWADKNSLSIKLDGLGARVSDGYDKVVLPWGDPLAEAHDKAANTVACCDPPEWKPDLDSSSTIKVYYHDRFPSIPVRSIIDDAIEGLNKNKKLHITKISFHVNTVDNGEVSLIFAADYLTDPSLRKVLEVIFPQKAFERFSHDLDKYAKLRAKWDTNTYIKMRIAYLLYQAVKLNKADAEKINLDIFRIFASSTRPNFNL